MTDAQAADLTTAQESFMRRAIALSLETMRGNHGGPFGAVVVKDGRIIAEGTNQVTTANDPTAHAEVVAIRRACQALGDFSLAGCEIYTSCEPCPMCLSSIYWARIERVYFANSRHDAAEIGFDDEFLYREIGVDLPARTIPMIRVMAEDARAAFDEWDVKPDKIKY